jgi:hypothetical protein
MKMVRHQNVCVNRHLELPGGVTQPTQESPIIVGLAKNRLPIVTALNDVMRVIWNYQSWKAGHGKYSINSDSKL